MHFVVLQSPKGFIRWQDDFPTVVPIAVEMLFLVLVDATVIAPTVLSGNCGKIVIGYHLLLLVIPSVFSCAFLAAERHLAVVDKAMIVVGVSVVTLFRGTLVFGHELTVFSPKVLAVPVYVVLLGKIRLVGA